MPGAPRVVTLTLLGALAVQALLVAAYLVTEPATSVDLSGEANLASWWSAALLLGAGFLAGTLYLCERQRGRRPPWALAVLALGFAGLSLEEVASVHERIGRRVGASGGEGEVSDWTLLYLPVLLFGGFAVLRVVAWLGRPLGTSVLVGLGVLALGVVGEMTLISDAGEGLAETLVEESSEVLGTLLLAGALASRLGESLAVLRQAGRAADEDAARLEPPVAPPLQAV